MNYLALSILLLTLQTANAVIIRGESRTQINSPKDAKAMKVGLLEAWNNNSPNKKSYCSASNISKNHIVTAAHCVIDIRTAKRFDNLVYYPRHVDFETRSPSRIFIESGFVLSEYIKENKKLTFNGEASINAISKEMIKNDIAILKGFSDKEQKAVGELYGWFGTKPMPAGLELGDIEDISIRSYPGDKPLGTLWYEDCYLRYEYSNIGRTNCDVHPGASGSAIVWKTEEYKYGQVVGVLSAESRQPKINRVALFTDEISRDIVNIINYNTHLNTAFEKIWFSTTKYYYFHVQNLCNEDVKVAIRIQNPDGSWETFERYNIGKNQRTKSIAPSKYAIYYYFAKSEESNTYWGDENNGVKRHAFGEKRWFYRKEVPDNSPTRWGDHYRQVGCD